jgi:putative Mg2+ transporter-C (MgtC) family protein
MTQFCCAGRKPYAEIMFSYADLLGDIRHLIPPPWSEVLLVTTSVLCGAAVGFEREKAEKPAGLRTLILICLGSTIFTIASIVLGGLERARIAAQIVTGVGFLGAGSILQARYEVRGLTTAASIWATAAVGIIVGAGYAVPGLVLSLAILITLSVLSRAERWFSGRCVRQRVEVVYQPQNGKGRLRIQGVLDQGEACRILGSKRLGDGREQVTLEYCSLHREHRGVLASLADLDAVDSLETPAT